jgi:hypothetical protein
MRYKHLVKSFWASANEVQTHCFTLYFNQWKISSTVILKVITKNWKSDTSSPSVITGCEVGDTRQYWEHRTVPSRNKCSACSSSPTVRHTVLDRAAGVIDWNLSEKDPHQTRWRWHTRSCCVTPEHKDTARAHRPLASDWQSGLVIGTSYPHWKSSWSSSVPPGKYRFSTLK